jgi:hypothetical protein
MSVSLLVSDELVVLVRALAVTLRLRIVDRGLGV